MSVDKTDSVPHSLFGNKRHVYVFDKHDLIRKVQYVCASMTPARDCGCVSVSNASYCVYDGHVAHGCQQTANFRVVFVVLLSLCEFGVCIRFYLRGKFSSKKVCRA